MIQPNTPAYRRAIVLAAPLLAAILPGCGVFVGVGLTPHPAPKVGAGVLTGGDNLDRYDVRLEHSRDGTALLTIAPGPNPLPQDAGPYPTATVHRGRWYRDEDEHGYEHWVLDVEHWPPMSLRQNFYRTRYETHARWLYPEAPPSACNDWGTVFALVSDDPTRR